jgi:Thiamine monophosphate synthase
MMGTHAKLSTCSLSGCIWQQRLPAYHSRSRHVKVTPAKLCIPQVSVQRCQASKLQVFPAGQKQAKAPSPALLLEVDAAQVLVDDKLSSELSEAISSGLNLVLLSARGDDGPLYDAALKLKEQLRDRVQLLIRDRVDIALAVGAGGVLLSSTG